jgi:hypothetical protein
MTRFLALALAAAIFSGCASTSKPEEPKPEASVEPPRHHEGKVVGGAGGALAGGAMAYSSAGILCTIGGPLCAIVVVPAAILGGVLGLAAGSVVDAARGAASEGGSPPGDTSARPGESARAEAPPQPY